MTGNGFGVPGSLVMVLEFLDHWPWFWSSWKTGDGFEVPGSLVMILECLDN